MRLSRQLDLNACPGVTSAVADAEEDLRGTGRVLLRPSGTEPVLRVMVEGESEQRVKRWAEHIAGAVKAAATA